jgi:alcohol dehydrogenase
MKLISENVVKVVDDGTNLLAREAMMYGSLIAGMAFGNTDVGAVHCISEAIGGLYDTPHGVANSVFLPWVFKYNSEVDIVRHAEIAEALGIARAGRDDAEVAAEGAALIADMTERVGIPRFADLPGVDPADFDRLAESSEANGSTPSNARPITKADYLKILNDAYAG